MCSTVILGEQEACTRGQLRALLGVEPIYHDIPEPSDEDCLCCCDLPATAALAGCKTRRDPLFWYFEREASK